MKTATLIKEIVSIANTEKVAHPPQTDAHLYLKSNAMVLYTDFYLYTILKDSNNFPCEEHYMARDVYYVEEKNGY